MRESLHYIDINAKFVCDFACFAEHDSPGNIRVGWWLVLLKKLTPGGIVAPTVDVLMLCSLNPGEECRMMDFFRAKTPSLKSFFKLLRQNMMRIACYDRSAVDTGMSNQIFSSISCRQLP